MPASRAPAGSDEAKGEDEVTVRVGINGFGRIGRNFWRAVHAMDKPEVEIVAANDLGDIRTFAHLLKYDTVLGTLNVDVSVVDGSIVAGDSKIKWLAERDPAKIGWGDLGVDVVIESTGIFTDYDGAHKHIEAGAKKVIISAPAKGEDITIVMGVNDGSYDPSAHHIIPNTTGAAKATALTLPALKGKLDGMAMRVPVMDGSVTDLVVQLEREATVAEVNEAYLAAATDGPLKNYLHYSTDPIVSSDIVGTPWSCTFDAPLTMASGDQVKVIGWYDNEWGYSNRLADLAAMD